MSLNSRIARLERMLASHHCTCDEGIDLGWPQHHPSGHCIRCGGERVICLLPHQPRASEARLRSVLPLLHKAYDGSERFDYSKLTDHELDQVLAAFRAHERESPQQQNGR